MEDSREQEGPVRPVGSAVLVLDLLLFEEEEVPEGPAVLQLDVLEEEGGWVEQIALGLDLEMLLRVPVEEEAKQVEYHGQICLEIVELL